ncbi:MAG TPA: hypothetical protein DD979_13140 [Gammaproteobacteria bacterium]|nr:hypothetical protein [Gammaproteobacteria bacterium]
MSLNRQPFDLTMQISTRLSTPLIASIFVAGTLPACSMLPSHNGSLHSVYGVDKTATAQTPPTAEPLQTPAPEPAYQPQVQTLTGPGVVNSAPISEISTTAAPEASTRAPINTPQTQTVPRATPNNYAPQTQTVPRAATPSDRATQTPTVSRADTPSYRGPQTHAVSRAAPPNYRASQPRSDQDHHHILGAGETLYSIASRFTGASTNWKRIADYNHIASPDQMTVGMEILIPLHLIITEERNALSPKTDYTLVSPPKSAFDASHGSMTAQQPLANRQATSPLSSELHEKPVDIAMLEIQAEPAPAAPATAVSQTQTTVTPLPNAPMTTDTVSTNAAAAATRDSTGYQPAGFRERLSQLANSIKGRLSTPATVAAAPPVPTVTFTGDKSEPISEPTPEAEAEPQVIKPQATAMAESAKPENNEWVKIGGDFTPKAIYKYANYSSGLLMRVSPGTTLKMTRQTNDWYEVETSKGAGFVFHRDAMIVR